MQGPPNTPVWSDKKPKALFRGRDSRQERLNVAKLSKRQNNSELLDAGITAFFFFPKDESIMADRIGFFDFFKVSPEFFSFTASVFYVLCAKYGVSEWCSWLDT